MPDLIKHILFATMLHTGIQLSMAQPPVFATISGGDLYAIDAYNCTIRYIGATGHGFGDIAMTSDGRLWGIKSGNLYHIDTATANATLIGNFGLPTISLVGLNDSILLTESGKKLYGINTSNASTFYIDSIGHQASGDLTWYDNDLYMVTSVAKIIRIEINAQYTDITAVTPLGNAVPTCEGVVTLPFMHQYNSIVGFNGPNLIKICQLDGSYEPLCPALHLGGTPGATTLRLPVQAPLPVSCIMPIDSQQTTSTSIMIYPTPSFGYFTIECKGHNSFAYTIYNTLGQLQMMGTSNSYILNISTELMASGMYIVNVKADGQSYTRKIVAHELQSP